MSNSSMVDYVKLSPNCNKPRNKPISKITIHHVEGKITVESLGDIFARPERAASSNYGIGYDGRVGMYVEEADRSWCSGSRENDNMAVTIEVSNDMNYAEDGEWKVSDMVMEKLIELCTDICRRNGIEKLNYTGDISGNLTMHKWFQNTSCPGPFLTGKFPWIASEVNKRLETDETEGGVMVNIELLQLSKGSYGAQVKTAQRILKDLGYTGANGRPIFVDGDFGNNVDFAVREFQRYKGLAADGIIGKNTWEALLK